MVETFKICNNIQVTEFVNCGNALDNTETLSKYFVRANGY